MYTLFIVTMAILAPSAFVSCLPTSSGSSIVERQVQQGGGGGLGTILEDHAKYMANPASALQPIPAQENNALRETHRQAHKSLFQVLGGAIGADAGAATSSAAAPATATPAAKTLS